ncbi:MAG: type II toxin-antitoxin system RelE/ParE family toxin [Candidatus Woesebacteria bacterium]|nr:type II toxin-antitoxin system RelE/ParE family toxin [Candidatus Woesebacteria bacterium]
MYKVVYFTTPSGKSPVKEFINKSEARLQKKIIRQIDYLEEFGLTTQNRYLRKLSRTPLWESRILGSDSTRIISVALIEKTVVVLHIFKKKTNKTPLGDIKISLQRYKNLTKYT